MLWHLLLGKLRAWPVTRPDRYLKVDCGYTFHFPTQCVQSADIAMCMWLYQQREVNYLWQAISCRCVLQGRLSCSTSFLKYLLIANSPIHYFAQVGQQNNGQLRPWLILLSPCIVTSIVCVRFSGFFPKFITDWWRLGSFFNLSSFRLINLVSVTALWYRCELICASHYRLADRPISGPTFLSSDLTHSP